MALWWAEEASLTLVQAQQAPGLWRRFRGISTEGDTVRPPPAPRLHQAGEPRQCPWGRE